jgi:ADP-ribosylation factor-binding protein GGA
MVKEDERKMDALTRRATELTMVNNNSKLLHEMLDHFDKDSCGREERELLKELFQSCEKMQPKLIRFAFAVLQYIFYI